ncbi:MAG: glycogen/starch synthase, partial [Acidocella sp.]|nr:glycogen/starch synthase [Acidocella sp.]
MRPVSVLAVAAELFPLIKTGGLADVAGALPLAMVAHGVATTTLLPGYPAVLAALPDAEIIAVLPQWFGGPAQLWRGQLAGLDLMVLDAPLLYDRPGGPYAGPDGADWPDNAIRFAALGRVAAWLGQRGVPGFTPDILHAHDWQAGLAMAYLQFNGGQRPRTVMTVHNLAFQGLFDASLLGALGLPPESFVVEGVEFYGMIGFLKAGLVFADRITTVSPRYAEDIKAPETGMGLDGLLRHRADMLRGIVNGIDDKIWDPATDPMLSARFDAATIDHRGVNKRALQEFFRLRTEPGALLLGVISRLTWQKGLDQLLETMPVLTGLGIQLAVLGAGEAQMEQGFAAAAAAHP